MGKAAALLFAREGAPVSAVDLDESAVAPVMREIEAAGGRGIAIGADVSRTTDVQRIGARTVAELGLPNVLLNNAGVDLEGKRYLIDTDEEAFDRTVAVNLKGPWLMTKHIVPLMIEAGGGSIINSARSGRSSPSPRRAIRLRRPA